MFGVLLKSVLASNRYLGFGFLCFVLVGVLCVCVWWVGWFGRFVSPYSSSYYQAGDHSLGIPGLQTCVSAIAVPVLPLKGGA